MNLARFPGPPLLLAICLAASIGFLLLGDTLGATPAGSAPKAELVYESNFDEFVRAKFWSDTRSCEIPASGKRMLGRFCDHDAATLTVRDLPPHQAVRLRATLVIVGSPDGNQVPFETDCWGACLGEKGPLLFMTSFDHIGPWRQRGEGRQSYPDEFPAGGYPSGTGAAGVGTKGFPFMQVDEKPIIDATYAIDWTIPHGDDEFSIRFFGFFSNGGLTDESWGLERVTVETLSTEPPLAEGEIPDLWDRLMGDDPAAADQALWRFVGSGAKGIDAVAQRTAGLLIECEKAQAHGRRRFQGALHDLRSGEQPKVARGLEAIAGQKGDAIPFLTDAVFLSFPGDGDVAGDPRALLRQALHTSLPTTDPLPAWFNRLSRVKRIARIAAPTSERARRILQQISESQSAPDPRGIRLMLPLYAVMEDNQRLPDIRTGAWALEDWTDSKSSASWWLKDLPAGKYRAEVLLACKSGWEGSTMEISVDGIAREFPVPDTADWTFYRWVEGGDFAIQHDQGSAKVSVAPKVAVKEGAGIANLRAVRLLPLAQ